MVLRWVQRKLQKIKNVIPVEKLVTWLEIAQTTMRIMERVKVEAKVVINPATLVAAMTTWLEIAQMVMVMAVAEVEEAEEEEEVAEVEAEEAEAEAKVAVKHATTAEAMII